MIRVRSPRATRLGESDSRELGRKLAILRPRYERFARSLEGLLARLLELEASVRAGGCACKSVHSFSEKLHRKQGRYSDPLFEMPDAVGVRIVVHFKSDVERVRTLVERELSVDQRETRSPEIASVLRRSATALSTSLPESTAVVGNFPSGRSTALKAEIQVRTLLEHAWAAIDHRLRYKPDKHGRRTSGGSTHASRHSWRRLTRNFRGCEMLSLPRNQSGRRAKPSRYSMSSSWAGCSTTRESPSVGRDLALASGFAPDKLLETESAAKYKRWSLLWVRLVASVAGITTVAALRDTLDRVHDDGARAALESVAKVARDVGADVTDLQIVPYDPISIVLHKNLRISPYTLIDISHFAWRDHDEIADFVQGWLGGRVVEAIEIILREH